VWVRVWVGGWVSLGECVASHVSMGNVYTGNVYTGMCVCKGMCVMWVQECVYKGMCV